MLQGVQARGGEDAALAHGAAEEMLPAPGAIDEVFASREHRANGTSQPLAQIDPDRIARRRVLARWNPTGDRRVEQPRAVHVRRKTALVREIADVVKLLKRPDRPATVVVGML